MDIGIQKYLIKIFSGISLNQELAHILKTDNLFIGMEKKYRNFKRGKITCHSVSLNNSPIRI